MTNSSPNSSLHSVISDQSWLIKTGYWVLTTGCFSAFLLFTLYLLTLAQTPVLGDPTEYTFVAHTLGIAHPPGYAFITLVGKLFQTLIPFGEISWRMHLLSAVSGTLSAVFVYGIVQAVTQHRISAVFAALVMGTAVDHWQHAIHVNPHILTATFLATNLYFLTRWWVSIQVSIQHSAFNIQHSNQWLFLFCLSAGLGVTHHPLTVFAFPAYALFIIWIRPKILTDWRTLLKMVAFALLGLCVWLYFPLRSSTAPFGPTTMDTLDGFLTHILGRGLTENLPYYSLADIPNRLLVFWSILRLQYSLPVIFLAFFGLLSPFLDKLASWQVSKLPNFHPIALSPHHSFTPPPFHPFILYTFSFLCLGTFVMSLKAQDIMAYILGPLLIVGLWAAIGLHWLIRAMDNLRLVIFRVPHLIILFFFLVGPVWQIIFNLPRVSLRDYEEGQAYIEAVFEQFAGQREDAVLLNDWEHMTPLWYAKFVEKHWPETADLHPVLVAAGTANPWLENVFQYLPGGPVYLSNYRRSIVDQGFRLRPVGLFYQVVEPGDTTVPPGLIPVSAIGEEIEVVGYEWGKTAVSAGDYVPLTLAMRAVITLTAYYVPVLHIGDVHYTFTTDSHLTTPEWLPHEVIIDRFDFALPHDLPGGRYPVTLDLKNLSTNQDIVLHINLGTLDVTAQTNPVDTTHVLANFRQRVGLVKAVARGENGRFFAPWNTPLIARPGEIIHLTLTWECLASPEQSYTVFVHLIDAANQPLVALDYTPLGGSMPTHLWIPKWLPGQQMLDPYRLQIPPDLPPGSYAIEVGLYETAYEPTSGRRLHISDNNGNLVGDRYILGTILVEN